MRNLIYWFFAAPRAPISSADIVLWWETRRIAFNAIIGCYGVVCLVIFLIAITSSGYLRPGEDAIEPIALVAAPVGINVLYTLGWLVEVSVRLVLPRLSPRFGPLLLKAGVGFGLFLITIPAAYWLGYRVLQIVGALA